MTVVTRMVFASLLIIGTVGCIYLQESATLKNNEVIAASPQEDISESIPEKPLKLNITLRRVYLDGEISEEKVSETVWALEDFWAKYEAWQLVDMSDEMVLFELKVDDISPLLKVNGFFGVSNDGTLSIYNGNPQQEDIIQSFFQIDIKKLEGNKHLELQQGIPVKTKEDYSDVLETMKHYSIDK
nr:intercompartmental signaling factor BofC [Lederbergia lenta]